MAVSSLRSLAQIEHRTGPVRCDTVWHHGAPGQPLTTRGEGAYHVCQVAEATYYCRYHTDRTRGLYVWDDCIPYLD